MLEKGFGATGLTGIFWKKISRVFFQGPLAALNPVRAVRKKITKISAERMWSGARVAQKKKKNWARKRKKFCRNRGTASLSGPPTLHQHPPEWRVCVGAGVGAQWCGFGGWRTHSPTHCPHCPEFFFSHWPHCPAPPPNHLSNDPNPGVFRRVLVLGGQVGGRAQPRPAAPTQKPGNRVSALPALPAFPTDPPHHSPTGAEVVGMRGSGGQMVASVATVKNAVLRAYSDM